MWDDGVGWGVEPHRGAPSTAAMGRRLAHRRTLQRWLAGMAAPSPSALRKMAPRRAASGALPHHGRVAGDGHGRLLVSFVCVGVRQVESVCIDLLAKVVPCPEGDQVIGDGRLRSGGHHSAHQRAALDCSAAGGRRGEHHGSGQRGAASGGVPAACPLQAAMCVRLTRLSVLWRQPVRHQHTLRYPLGTLGIYPHPRAGTPNCVSGYGALSARRCGTQRRRRWVEPVPTAPLLRCLPGLSERGGPAAAVPAGAVPALASACWPAASPASVAALKARICVPRGARGMSSGIVVAVSPTVSKSVIMAKM